MALEVLLIRQGQRLAAADPISLEAIEGIREKETVTATLRRARNPRHHAKLFALLNIGLPHQKAYPTTGDLLVALKISTGLFDTVQSVDRIPIIIPKSISFASMSQSDFEQWYERAVDVITTRILPLVNKDDLNDEVASILAGYQNSGSHAA
jgi:Protein of unknown function (DUF1367)